MNENLKTFWDNAVIENKNKNLESVSGVGSTLRYTENLRNQLPILLKEFSIKTIFDAPCGDMNWMNVFLKENKNINYIGGDIVESLVVDNQQYANDRIKIINADISSTPFPEADLWLCRDCWFHLPDEFIFKSIDNFLKSNIKFILTTTHINTGFQNTNLKTVDFKLIDLFSDPYNFPEPIFRITDYYGKKHPREMVLFSREQLVKWKKFK